MGEHDSDSWRDLLPQAVEIARVAGAATLAHFRCDTEVSLKADSTPVTEADHAAERLILERLSRLTPDIPVVSEEAYTAEGGAPPGTMFWLVDPLDGTKEFIAGRDEFTVNLGLVKDGQPVLGVVLAPARSLTYAGCNGHAIEIDGDGTKPIHVRTAPTSGLVVVASRSHRSPREDAFLKDYDVDTEISAGSSLKFGLVAAGRADLYPRFGPTMEWDTAAGHAVLIAAGGSVTTMDGAPLTYGKTDFRNPAFVARGGSER